MSAIDRREFISGRILNADAGPNPPKAEIASVLVQARPERLAAATDAIRAMPGTEIHSSDPRGKLVVVIEAPDTGAIGETLNTIALLPDVITASLVYHASDYD